jgi:hypothetical protein
MLASELVNVAETCGVSIDGRDDDGKARWIGIHVGKAFRDHGSERLPLEGYTVIRKIEREFAGGDSGTVERKYYCFEKDEPRF